MGLSDEVTHQDAEQKFRELCADLNMDRNAAMEAWQSYEKIGQNYTLEGEALHWLACALYVSCRSVSVPTVGKSGTMIEGNCVSLTRLLRSSKLRGFSLLQFFSKMKKWSDMASLPQDFRNKVDQLEKNFAVSTVIFKKFEPIFLATFKEPIDEAPRVRSRKQKRQPCTSSELFAFCWTLFVKVKGNFPAISDDLVNSYHLLLCCVDFLYNNVLLADRRDLLNPTFVGLPENFGTREYKAPVDAQCIIQLLCEKHDGLVVEAKGIKEHWWKPYIKKLFDRKDVKGEASTLSGLIDLGNFESNNKAINNAYERFVLNVGDFDERIFLGDEASAEIGTLSKTALASAGDLNERMQVKRNLQQHMDSTRSLAPHTPLTGRRYLTGKEVGNVTPVSTATQSVSKLQTLLSGRQTTASDILLDIYKECSNNPADAITSLIKSMGETFCTFYAQPSDDHQGSHVDFAKKRLQLGESLFYKALECIMLMEKRRLPAKFDFSALLGQELFHRSLFACCLEIVIFSYNSQRAFPWIMDIFNLEPYNFYKVIEVLIRVEDGLSRDVVKHLNHIEEQILESLAWKSESPLWDAIKESGIPIPVSEDVSLPKQEITANITMSQLSSPVQHPTIARLASVDRSLTKISHLSSPVTDRFQSPPTGGSSMIATNGALVSAKRRLFATTMPLTFATRPVTITTTSPSGRPENETVLLQANGTSAAATLLSPSKTLAFAVQPQGEGGCITYVPAQFVTIPLNATLNPMSSKPITIATSGDVIRAPPKKPKRTGSLGLFFRKFYNVAGVRLRYLCDKLEITDEDHRKKIWTCFEHSIVQNSELMMDRHLDQLLMCATYVMAKVTGPDKRFQEIMKCYRLQPQAASHVYRSVLLHSKKRRNSGSSEGSKNEASESNSPVPMEKEDKDKDEKHKLRLAIRSSSTLPADGQSVGSQPPTPTNLAGTSSSFEFEDRGDLITFYNTVYIKSMQKFVVRFSTNKTKGTESPPLSPLPVPKSYNVSPRRRVSNNHSVFISPLKCSPSPSRPLSYSFNRSPAKDLRAINSMVKLGVNCKIGKRLLQDDGDVPADSAAKRACSELTFRRINSVIAERQEVRASGCSGNSSGSSSDAVAMVKVGANIVNNNNNVNIHVSAVNE